MMFEQSVRVFAKPAVDRATRRLHVRDVPGCRTEHAKERFGMHGAGAELGVERLLKETALRGPVVRQLCDQVLQRHDSGLNSFTTRAERTSFSRWSAINIWWACSSSPSAAP